MTKKEKELIEELNPQIKPLKTTPLDDEVAKLMAQDYQNQEPTEEGKRWVAREEWLKTHLPSGEDVEDLADELEEEDEIARQHNFYYLTKDKRTGDVKIKFDTLAMINKLRSLGYYRYDQPNGSFEYVYIKDNKIELISSRQIIDAFEDYVRHLPDCDKVTDTATGTLELHVTRYMILQNLYQSISNIFSDTNLERLRPLGRPIRIMHDTAKEKYFFYRNCVVCVTKDRIFDIDYSQIKIGNIMANSIIDRDYMPDDDTKWNDPDGDFFKFCLLISGNDHTRLLSLMTILGYLMHDYYDTDLRAAYFTDVNMDNSKRAAGGTGKGILGYALSLMLNRNSREDTKYVAIPGKGFVATDPKRYAAADITTQLIHIQDLDKKFRFGDLYNDITDGATFQKHYKNPVYRRVKIMLSMNQALDLQGSSDKRRVVIFELANFFSEKLRPENYFKHRFFDKNWGKEQWARFDDFMLHCVMAYLQMGIKEPQIINLDKRAILEVVGENLYYWLEEKDHFGGEPNIRQLKSKESMYLEFCKKYPGEFPSQRLFTEACMNYLTMKNIRSSVWRDGKDWYILYPSEDDYQHKKLQNIV